MVTMAVSLARIDVLRKAQACKNRLIFEKDVTSLWMEFITKHFLMLPFCLNIFQLVKIQSNINVCKTCFGFWIVYICKSKQLCHPVKRVKKSCENLMRKSYDYKAFWSLKILVQSISNSTIICWCCCVFQQSWDRPMGSSIL